MLKIFNQNHAPIGYIQKYTDLKRESVLSTGEKTLSFTYLSNTHELDCEYYIQDKTDEYVVKEIRESTDGYPQITAVMNVEELEGKAWKTFLVRDSTPEEAANLALAGTGWRVAGCSIDKRRNMGLTNVSTKIILQKICAVFLCEMTLDSKNKTVSFFEQAGKDRGVYFMCGLNLKKASLTGDTYEYYTRIIPVGKDGLKITEVNDGKEYLDNHQYSSKVLTYIWEDSSYEDAEALKEDAKKKLSDMSRPKKAYSAEVRDLARQSEKYSILEYGLGDTVTLLDRRAGIRDKQRIVRLVEYPQNPDKNTCDMANTRETFDELQNKMREAASIIEAAANLDGTLNGAAVDKITMEQIWDINEGIEEGIQNSSTVSNLSKDMLSFGQEVSMVKADMGELEATVLKAADAELKYAAIKDLDATKARVGSIEGDYAFFKTTATEELAAKDAQIDSLRGDLAQYKTVVAGEIDAVAGKFDTLGTQYASIDLANIENGCITAAMIGTGAVQTAQIADGSITDAKVVNLTANKITAGTLSVERLEIRGSTGSIVYALNNIPGALQARNVDTLNGEVLTPRTITADRIVAGSITGNEIAAKTLTANHIVANAITAESGIIADAAVTGAKIANAAITAAKIKDAEITGAKIKDLSVTNAKIADATIEAAKIKSMDAGKITTGVLSADRIDVEGLFAKEIRATGKITGATLSGAVGSFENIKIKNALSMYTSYSDVDYQVLLLNEIGQAGIHMGQLSVADDPNIYDIYFTNGREDRALIFDEEGRGHVGQFTMGACNILFGKGTIYKNGTDMMTALITPGDKRNAATTPNSYSNALIFQGIKLNSVIGSPHSSSFSYLLGLRGWNNASGGKAHELAFNDGGIYHRVGATAWESWKVLLDSANYSNYAAPKSHTHAYIPISGYSSTIGINYAVGSNWKAITSYSGDGTTALGTSANRYTNVYAKSGVVSTSDEKEKDIISGITEPYEQLFMGLLPILYSWKNFKDEQPVHDRIHCGLGAQTTLRVARQYGLDEKSFAAVCRDSLDTPTADGRAERWGMAYTELIPLTIHMVQKNALALTEVQSTISQTREEIAEIKRCQNTYKTHLTGVKDQLHEALQKISEQERMIQSLRKQLQEKNGEKQ